MFWDKKKANIEELSRVAKYYILDLSFKEAFMVISDEHEDENGKPCKKGVFFAEKNDGWDTRDGIIYNSELRKYPSRFDYTMIFKYAYLHASLGK